MSEFDRDSVDQLRNVRMSKPEMERQPWKIGCWTYFCVIAFALIVLVWFNIFRSGPPLRIAKDTTYITEPLTPDGSYVDYFAALEQRVYPPEMRTDENGYRVVFRDLGDFANETGDFEWLQQRYDKLGLDVIRDKPTLTYAEPGEFFKNRYISHPEEFDDIITLEKDKRLVEIKENLHESIVETESDPDLTAEEKEELIAFHREMIAWWEMTEEERCEKAIADIQDEIDEINNDPVLSDEEKAEQIAELKQSAIDYALLVGDVSSDFHSLDYWQSLLKSPELHQNTLVQKWLEESNAALDLVAEQVKKPVFVTPYIGKNGALTAMLLPDVFAIRSFARGLQARALIRHGEGDMDACIDDILACY